MAFPFSKFGEREREQKQERMAFQLRCRACKPIEMSLLIKCIHHTQWLQVESCIFNVVFRFSFFYFCYCCFVCLCNRCHCFSGTWIERIEREKWCWFKLRWFESITFNVNMTDQWYHTCKIFDQRQTTKQSIYSFMQPVFNKSSVQLNLCVVFK